MWRTVLAVIAGVVVAQLTVLLGESIGHTIFPPPADFDLSQPGAYERLMQVIPTGAIIAVLVAWAAGSFVGGSVAASIARKSYPTWIVGALMLAAGIATMIWIPHPTWFAVASVPAALVPAWLAGRLFGHSS